MSRASSSSSASQYNICLICGSHTNLVLNIFEPRCGPNIVDIIFAKFKFKAEKNSSDKYICYDCNNWLINWFSLQNLNEQQSSEPSESGKNANVRKSMDNYNNPNKNHNHSDCVKTAAADDNDAVVIRKNNQKMKFKDRRKKIIVRKSIYSCLLCKFPSIHHQIVKKYKNLLKSKTAFNNRKHQLLKKYKKKISPPSSPAQQHVPIIGSIVVTPDLVNQNNVVSSSSCDDGLSKPPPSKPVSSADEEFDDRILKMLKKQGTLVFSETDENKSQFKLNLFRPNSTFQPHFNKHNNFKHNTNDIVINFNSDITEVLKIKKCKEEEEMEDVAEYNDQENGNTIKRRNGAILDQLDRYFKLPKSLSISILDDTDNDIKPKIEPMDNKFWKVKKEELVSIVID